MSFRSLQLSLHSDFREDDQLYFRTHSTDRITVSNIEDIAQVAKKKLALQKLMMK